MSGSHGGDPLDNGMLGRDSADHGGGGLGVVHGYSKERGDAHARGGRDTTTAGDEADHGGGGGGGGPDDGSGRTQAHKRAWRRRQAHLARRARWTLGSPDNPA